jgi:hypothetical protein
MNLKHILNILFVLSNAVCGGYVSPQEFRLKNTVTKFDTHYT